MRDNRNKWKFITDKKNVRIDKHLDAHEIRYWKDILYRILKVGIEFELNLPKGKDGCAGGNLKCGCYYMTNRQCWSDCANTTYCRNVASLETCGNRSEDCKPENCQHCENYSFVCIGIGCNEFAPRCWNCQDFVKACKTCEKYQRKSLPPAEVRKKFKNAFKPSGSYGKVGSGVVRITKDGSLVDDGGVEIITVGRRVNYWEFYTMSKKILDMAKKHGAYVNERCGAHMHVLASYYENTNELERPMPEIILANLHQLIRKYQNALTWITMALGDPNHMTRWEKFRVSILDISPVKSQMYRVSEKIINNSGGNKYGFVNYKNCRFSPDGDVEIFHIEFREADATLCPSIYAALACLHFAFVIKAVEISRYGLLVLDDPKAKEMKNVILNGAHKSYSEPRFSNTSELLDHAEYFREEAMDMLAQMKNILIKLGPAYDVLEKLAYKPVALRRIEGDKWDDIEKSLEVRLNKESQVEIKIDEAIDLRLVDDCTDVEEWIRNVTEIVNETSDVKITSDDVKNYIEDGIREGNLIWSSKLGTIISI